MRPAAGLADGGQGTMTSKYDRRADHLATFDGQVITLTFAEVKTVVGPLPAQARRAAEWWSAGDEKYARYAHVTTWRRQGFVAERPDFKAGTVTFRRVEDGGVG